MNWQDDPILADEVSLQQVRAGLWRSVIIWTPPFLLAAAGFIFFVGDLITGGGRGGPVIVVVVGILAFLFGHEAIQAMLDLRGEPEEIEDIVTQRWHRNDSIVIRTHYVRIGPKLILRGGAGILADIKEGQRVVVRYYTHSAIVIAIKPVRGEDPRSEPPVLPLA